MGRIWEGGDIAQEMLEKVRAAVIALQRAGCSPLTLAEIRVSEGPHDHRLQDLQEEACRFTGVSYEVRPFPLNYEHHTVMQVLAEFNADPNITGITIHAPPAIRLGQLAGAVAIEKDVDGLHPLHLGRLITNKHLRRITRGADLVQLLKHAGIVLTGAHVICIGNASGLASLLGLLCLHENATISAWRDVTMAPRDVLARGDVLILDSDDGLALDGTALKPGAVVIDARSRPQAWMPLQPEEWFHAASLLIPVPGGVGPTTVAWRLSALVALCRMQDSIPSDC